MLLACETCKSILYMFRGAPVCIICDGLEKCPDCQTSFFVDSYDLVCPECNEIELCSGCGEYVLNECYIMINTLNDEEEVLCRRCKDKEYPPEWIEISELEEMNYEKINKTDRIDERSDEFKTKRQRVV